MAITDGIVTLLKSNSSIAALCKSIVPVGIVKGIISPAIVYHIGTTQDVIDTSGSTGFRLARFQFDVYSTNSYTEARKLAAAIRKALQNFQNTVLADGHTYVQACTVDMESDLPMIPDAPTSTSAIEFRTMVQVTIFYQE